MTGIGNYSGAERVRPSTSSENHETTTERKHEKSGIPEIKNGEDENVNLEGRGPSGRLHAWFRALVRVRVFVIVLGGIRE